MFITAEKILQKVPYLTPAIGYYSKTGLFVEAAPSFFAKSGSIRLDLYTATTGYDYSSKNQNFSTGAYFSKYFYDNNSTSVKSVIKVDAGVYIGYGFGTVMLSGGADYLSGSKADFLTGIALSHSFDFGSDDSFSVAPQLLFNADTQNFYKGYSSIKPPGIMGALENESKFGALDYEFSAPFSYNAKNGEYILRPPMLYLLTRSMLRTGLAKSLTNRISKIRSSEKPGHT